VDLPAPDGEDTTSIKPRRAMAAPILNPSFDVLHLLAKLVDHRLQRQTHMGELNVGGFGAQRIRLTVKFLCKKIELSAGSCRRSAHGPRQWGGKPVHSSRKSARGEHGDRATRLRAFAPGRESSNCAIMRSRKIRLLRASAPASPVGVDVLRLARWSRAWRLLSCAPTEDRTIGQGFQ
jgi:hypothetical protein